MKRALAPSCLLLCLLAAAAGCAVTDPTPYAQGLLQPGYNRAWNNAIDALKDEGLQVVMADLAGGTLEGRTPSAGVNGRVTRQSGGIQAEFTPAGIGPDDAKLAERVQARWATRMAGAQS